MSRRTAAGRRAGCMARVRAWLGPAHRPGAGSTRPEGEGLDPRAIADQLVVSLHTARGHVKNVLTMLGAHSQLQAVVVAAPSGLPPAHMPPAPRPPRSPLPSAPSGD